MVEVFCNKPAYAFPATSHYRCRGRGTIADGELRRAFASHTPPDRYAPRCLTSTAKFFTGHFDFLGPLFARPLKHSRRLVFHSSSFL